MQTTAPARGGRFTATIGVGVWLLTAGVQAGAQDTAREWLEQAAAALGGLDRLRALDNVVMTGFGQYLNQQGGGNPSPDPRAPGKWQAANDIVRSFDLRNQRALIQERRNFMFPFAAERGHSWAQTSQLQTGLALLDHPLTVVLAALDPSTRQGPVTSDGRSVVVELGIDSGDTLWLGLDPGTKRPNYVRWIAPSTTLGDVVTTTYFTGYLPQDGVWLPTGVTTGIDWRDTTIASLHIDSYRFDVDPLPPFPLPAERGPDAALVAEATPLADGVWDVRVGGNGGAVIEFDDHLTMFEAYGNEAATFARIDRANQLVRGKQVTEVIVSHHHFDHSGGLRAAVSRGLRVISRRGNEAIFREMVGRPAPVFPDALARRPRALEFVPVDEHLVLEDRTMRVDVYHVVGHMHMAEAVFAYVPEHRILLEGDFTTVDWDFNWWGGAYLDNVDRYELDPAINVPVHGIVTSFDETIAGIEAQVARARDFCARLSRNGAYQAGCPVKYSREQ